MFKYSSLFLIAFLTSINYSFGNINGVIKIPLSFHSHAYVTDINIGTPPRRIRYELSMINQGLWLSPDMNFCQGTGKGRTCIIINGFHPKDSVTYSELSTDDYNVYHKKSVSKDILMIGHDMRSANEVKFTYSTSGAKWSRETQSTGELGLGFNLKDGNDTNLIDQLYEKSVVNSKVAGFRFRKMKIFEGYQTNAGETTIGSHVGEIVHYILDSRYGYLDMK